MKLTVCVDLDGVLAHYDGWKGVEHFGNVIPGAREFLQGLKDAGFEVAIYTTRCNGFINGESQDVSVARVADWLKRNDLPYDKLVPGKPLYIAVVDDRAVNCVPQQKPQAFDETLETIKKWGEQYGN